MSSEIQALLFLFLLIALGIFLLWFFIFKVKHLKTSDIFLVDGGVKVGKSLISVMLAVKRYKRNCLKVRIFNFFRRFKNKFRKVKKAPLDMPMLYSNMPLYKVKYNEFTFDVLFMKVRLPYKSVVLIDEATLLADSMTGMQRGGKSKQEQYDFINEKLTLFLKTFGHQTHGGFCVYNTQNVVDLHFAFRRCTSTYIFCSHSHSFILFRLVDVREVIHDESGDIVNTVQQDVDVDNRPLFVSRRWYKYYDRYYLDVLTKNLPLFVNYDVEILDIKKRRIAIDKIITLCGYKTIVEYNNRHNVKKNESEVIINEKA